MTLHTGLGLNDGRTGTRSVRKAIREISNRTWFEALESRRMFSAGAASAVDALLELALGNKQSPEQQLTLPRQTGPMIQPATYPTTGPVAAVAPPPTTNTNNAPPPEPPSTTTGPSRSRSDFRYILRPGDGWTGPTPQPDPVGNPGSPGYDAKSIARWDVVPYQTFTGEFHIGVVAFHMNGIDRVEFSVNGGEWTAVRQMTKNPQTDVYEYTATLRASDFQDGQLEVRAIAWPKAAGKPRVLESLPLNSNANGTLPSLVRYVSPNGSDANDGLTAQTPKASIVKAAMSIQSAQGSADGGIIYLTAGNYTVAAGQWNELPTTTRRWLTITRAAGLTQSEITIIGNAPNSAGNNDGIQAKLIKIAGVTLTGRVLGSGKMADDAVWYDDVRFQGSGIVGSSFNEGQFNRKYVTNSSIYNVQDAIIGHTLVRNVTIDTIGQSGIRDTQLVINCTISNTSAGNGSLHPDVYQFTQAMPNSICYGLTAVIGIEQTTGIRMQPSATDVAIVGAKISMGTSSLFLWELERPYSRLLIKDSTLNGAFRYTGTFSADCVVFENNIYHSGQPAPHPGVILR